jgi:hypothetical protein
MLNKHKVFTLRLYRPEVSTDLDDSQKFKKRTRRLHLIFDIFVFFKQILLNVKAYWSFKFSKLKTLNTSAVSNAYEWNRAGGTDSISLKCWIYHGQKKSIQITNYRLLSPFQRCVFTLESSMFFFSISKWRFSNYVFYSLRFGQQDIIIVTSLICDIIYFANLFFIFPCPHFKKKFLQKRTYLWQFTHYTTEGGRFGR